MKDDGSTIEERLEAALEEVAEYEQLAALMRRREEPWIKRWQQETGKAHTLPDYGEFLGWLITKLDVSRTALVSASGAIKVLARHDASQGVDMVLAQIKEALG